MADYDVGTLALVVPSSSAPRATYRPAVSVQNMGVHDALASGYLRIYAAGLLVFQTELYSGTIVPGATGLAQAIDYWSPELEGKYEVHGYLTTPLDQVESNNMLQPVTVEITAEAPPTPPAVPAHAAQHEEGAADEISIDGLKGRAADPQDALAHAAQHQAGGSDQLNVGSLIGELAQDQPTKVHGNVRHDPAFASSASLSSHAGSIAAHTAAANLEQTAHKGQPDGYAGLDNVGHVVDSQLATVPTPTPNAGDALTFGSGWSQANALPHAEKHELAGDDEINVSDLPGVLAYKQKAQRLAVNSPGILVGSGGVNVVIAALAIPDAWKNNNLQATLEAHGALTSTGSPTATLTLKLLLGASVLASQVIDTSVPDIKSVHVKALFHNAGYLVGHCLLRSDLVPSATPTPQLRLSSSGVDANYNIPNLQLKVTASFANAAPGDSLAINGYIGRNDGEQT